MIRSLPVLTLLALAAFVPIAAAQSPCPECDPDGAGDDNASYSSIDLGVIGDHAEAVGDTDASVSDSDHEDGFFMWLAICLSAWLDDVTGLLGLEVDNDANAELYATDDGFDLDANVTNVPCVVPGIPCGTLSYDESAVGDLDGESWEALGSLPVDPEPSGVGEHVPDGLWVDLCVYLELEIAGCG